MRDFERCGAQPPKELQTRSGQSCVLVLGHDVRGRDHRTYDLVWPIMKEEK